MVDTMSSELNIDERILKDIALFDKSRNMVGNSFDDPRIKRIVDLSEMYAKDAKSYLEKGDKYTAFSCISYAHGLLDAVKELKGMNNV
jgi:hypothetical protein